MQQNYKSNIKLYLVLWLLLIFISVILFVNMEKQSVFIIYFLITLIFSVVINFYEGRRINNYLQNNNNQQYTKNITFNEKTGVFNNFEAFGFLISNNSDTMNPDIKSLKSNYVKTLVLIFLIFLSYPILYIIAGFIK